MFIDLSPYTMFAVAEEVQTPGGLQSKNTYYFVVGSTNIVEKNINLRSAYGGRNGIPSGTRGDNTYSVVLLKSDTMKLNTRKYKSSLPVAMTDEEIEYFEMARQDIVTYGET